MSAHLQELIHLSHTLGSLEHDWAILGEGNTSTRRDEDRFYVKASGSQLRLLTEVQVACVRFAPVLEALHTDRTYTDAETKDLLLSSVVDTDGRMPSVETVFHAFLLTLPGVAYVGHTHVTTINGLLCSERGWKAMQSGGRIFPDEVVVCGIAPCCVPYTDPGLPLARMLRDQVIQYQETYGDVPKTIYLQNHGFIALGGSVAEVVNITMMADKSARIMLGTMACGGPAFLTPDIVRRIASRPDEHFRQRALGLKPERE